MASCLDSPVREHTIMTLKKTPKTKEADPLTLTLTCAQNLFVDRTFIN